MAGRGGEEEEEEEPEVRALQHAVRLSMLGDGAHAHVLIGADGQVGGVFHPRWGICLVDYTPGEIEKVPGLRGQGSSGTQQQEPRTCRILLHMHAYIHGYYIHAYYMHAVALCKVQLTNTQQDPPEPLGHFKGRQLLPA